MSYYMKQAVTEVTNHPLIKHALHITPQTVHFDFLRSGDTYLMMRAVTPDKTEQGFSYQFDSDGYGKKYMDNLWKMSCDMATVLLPFLKAK